MDVDCVKFWKCWKRITSVVAVPLICYSILNIIVALVYASDCPDKGYKIPFFLLAFGIIGVFTAIMIFFSNSLWSKSNSFNCEGSKETVSFFMWISLGLTFLLCIFVFVGLIFGANADSAQCVDVVRKYTLVMCSLGLSSFVVLCGVCTFIGGD